MKNQIDELMEQAQVFASAWSLVGGRFDNGNAMDEAEVAKSELRQMLIKALAEESSGTEHMVSEGRAIKLAMAVANDMRIEAMKAQPQQEPVATIPFCRVEDVYNNDSLLTQLGVKRGDNLYTSPPASKPLTDEQIAENFYENVDTGSLLSFADGVRFAEAAHGIKG